MIEIESSNAISLMRDFGLPEWSGSDECKYYLWKNCCLFAVVDYGSAIQMHMAMSKFDRKKSWLAGNAFIDKFGDRLIIAPIINGRLGAVALAKKNGFKIHHRDFNHNGVITDIYVRYPNGTTY